MTKALGAFALAWMALFASMAAAAIHFPPTFNQMFESFNADSLVRAQVKEKEALYVTQQRVDEWWRESEVDRIFTRYLMVLEDVVSGDEPPSTFYLYLPGGTVDGVELWDSRSFELEVDWEVVLFLQYDKLNDMYYSAGTAQTVFVVQRLPDADLLINLKDFPPKARLSDLALTTRVEFDLDDRVYPQDGPARLLYESLKAVFGEGQEPSQKPRQPRNP